MQSYVSTIGDSAFQQPHDLDVAVAIDVDGGDLRSPYEMRLLGSQSRQRM